MVLLVVDFYIVHGFVAETSWYNTEDTIYDVAVVHTESKGKRPGELYLNPGDTITDLEKTDVPGYWKVIGCFLLSV